MSSQPRTLGVIPARGGSKRVSRKNIRQVWGRPLIAWTIEAAKHSNLTKWIVSTEDAEIEQIALSYGAHVLKRPDYLAGDSVSSIAVCKHALDAMEIDSDPFDMVVLLHPTSPIRSPKHIDEAVALLAQSNAPSLASVSCRKRSYVHNASIYALKTPLPENHYSDESIPYLMDRYHSLDIDEEVDLKIAEVYMQCLAQ